MIEESGPFTARRELIRQSRRYVVELEHQRWCRLGPAVNMWRVVLIRYRSVVWSDRRPGLEINVSALGFELLS